MLEINFDIYKDKAVYSYYSKLLNDSIYKNIDTRDLKKYYMQLTNGAIPYTDFLQKYDMQIYKEFLPTYSKIIEYIEKERLQELEPKQNDNFIFNVDGHFEN